MSVSANRTAEEITVGQSLPDQEMIWISGGTFRMGSDKHYPEEGPVHAATVAGFWMDKCTVTNEQFARFVEATGYVTLAEKAPRAEDYPGANLELLKPASTVFRKPPRASRRSEQLLELVDLRYWRELETPGRPGKHDR